MYLNNYLPESKILCIPWCSYPFLTEVAYIYMTNSTG